MELRACVFTQSIILKVSHAVFQVLHELRQKPLPQPAVGAHALEVKLMEKLLGNGNCQFGMPAERCATCSDVVCSTH